MLDRAAAAGGREPRFGVPRGRHAEPGVRQLIEARVRRGELVPVALKAGARRSTGRRAETLEAGPAPAEELVHILSPFDPLIIQRKRLKVFFDYEHRFEAYVPKEKRVFGYSPCPCSSATRSSPPSTSRRIAGTEAPHSKMDMGREEAQPRRTSRRSKRSSAGSNVPGGGVRGPSDLDDCFQDIAVRRWRVVCVPRIRSG